MEVPTEVRKPSAPEVEALVPEEAFTLVVKEGIITSDLVTPSPTIEVAPIASFLVLSVPVFTFFPSR